MIKLDVRSWRIGSILIVASLVIVAAFYAMVSTATPAPAGTAGTAALGVLSTPSAGTSQVTPTADPGASPSGTAAGASGSPTGTAGAGDDGTSGQVPTRPGGGWTASTAPRSTTSPDGAAATRPRARLSGPPAPVAPFDAIQPSAAGTGTVEPFPAPMIPPGTGPALDAEQVPDGAQASGATAYRAADPSQRLGNSLIYAGFGSLVTAIVGAAMALRRRRSW